MIYQLDDIVRRVQTAFRQNPDRSYTARQMYKHLGIKEETGKAMVKHIMQDMARQGLLQEVKEGKYKPLPTLSPSHKRAQTGTQTGSQIDNVIIGTLILTNRGGIVCGLNDKEIRDNIVIRSEYLHSAVDGQKVVVRLLRHGTTRRLPEGEIIEVLGTAGDNDTEMHAILTEYGLPYSYPEALEQEANLLGAGITAEEISKRLDMRDRLTFTIDPQDAKDFDDAISLRTLSATDDENRRYEVGVHIADVTHYVQIGSALDREAYRRGTSIYLVDRTIPMLPEHLSNGICSLRPDEEKLCMSVIFTLDKKAHVLDHKICRTVIRSDRRFCYEEVQEIIENAHPHADEGQHLLHSIDEELRYAILTLNDLAKILRQNRFDHGAIQFDREEMRFKIDEAGKPISVYLKRQTEANNLIEEFMLLANRTIAQAIDQKLPFVYRVHDVPDPDRLDALSRFIRRFGYNLKTQSTRKDTISKNINNLLASIKGKTEENVIETLTIRSMAKAVYSTENIGHYGLAFRHYTHFTSPIRRYPDMMVHRLVSQYLLGLPKQPIVPYTKELEDACEHCSAAEQQATLAERASTKYKQAEFLQDKIGLAFDGHISGVTEYGLYVQIDDNHCEGFVPLRFVFDNDYALYDADNYSIYGERTQRRLTLGDAVLVRVIDVNLDRKQIDLQILS